LQKESTLVQRVEAVTGHPTAAICRALHVARSTAYLQAKPRPLNSSDVQLLLDRSVWGRFGEATLCSPIEIERLTDSDGIFTAFETRVDAEDLGFKPITTPAYSPESNGIAEAFVNTLKRDYVGGANLADAETVMRQIPAWLVSGHGAAFFPSA
jgi:transposase InsO family protein